MIRIAAAVLLSLFCPGLGQYYNRDYKKGHWILFFTLALFILPSYWIVRQVVPRLPDPGKEVWSQEQVQDAAMAAVGRNRHVLNLISFAFLGLWAYSITQSFFKAREIAEQKRKSGEKEEPPAT